MLEYVSIVIIIALLACWVILFAGKLGVIEWVQVHTRYKLIAELFSCQFCLSWWVCVIISICFAIATGDIAMLLCPFCSTPLTRYYL